MTSLDELKAIAPHMWAMYQHVFEERSKLENRLSYFLAVDTLFTFCFLQLFQKELLSLSLCHLIPFLMLLGPALVMFANFHRKGQYLPWFEEQDLIKLLEENAFHREWLASMYSSLRGSFEYMKRTARLLQICVVVVGLSLFWMLVWFVTSVYSSALTGAEKGIVFVLILTGICGIYWVPRGNPKKSRYMEMQREVSGYFESWLSSKASERP